MDIVTANLDKALAKNIGGTVTTNLGQALRLRCVGYAESSAHYADAVLVSNTSLVLSIDGVADTTVGSGGTLAFATYTTLGKLVDAINLSDNWEAEIVAGLRSDAINGSELLARSTSTFRMYQTVVIYFDSDDNGNLGFDFLLEPNQEFEYVHGTAGLKSYKQHRVGFYRAKLLVNTNAGETIDIVVSELRPDKASVYKELARFTATDNTEKDTGATTVPLVHAGYGNSILVRARGTGWVDASAYLHVFGVKE